MINLDYAFHHLECVVAIISGRKEALDRMDISADGFWRSFAAIPLSLPAMFFTWVISARQTQTEMPAFSIGALVATEAFVELVLWLLPIVVLALILGRLGFGGRFTHLIIVRNWTAVIVTYVVAAAFLPYLALPVDNGAMILVTLILFVVIMLTVIRVTQSALECSTAMAIGLVVAELVLGLFIASALYGLILPPSA